VDEKRKFPRLEIPVDVRWEKMPSKKRWGWGREVHMTRNISAGGICLIVYEDVAVGECLKLAIDLPTHKTIHATGRIVWTTPFEVSGDEARDRRDIGIEFLEIKPEDREEISKFVFSAGKG
jgi:c-di-GMP-binding flagellar brake protein YcgR